ncbi:hypothetical protein [Paraferrimonas sedimenticola]|uniref:Lipoprotein n=1 Tax=Paraferrimonas sedimenticola TaxID=375674 RepID=A0AA37RVX8_9GAMM|nr:hypothetical protein [Paraferrimonas sedimenticola]GLP96815.1 hypothetical protein GCM10007895_21210 [Paraferrimonas sedimenticola]
MKHWSWLIVGLFLLSGCATKAERNACSIIASYQTPELEQNHFRLLVTAINDKPVMSRPMYQLAPGKVTLQLVELIDHPELGVAPEQRHFETMELDLKPNLRYHLVARFVAANADGPGYWEPIVVETEVFNCSMEQPYVAQPAQ